MTTALSTAWSSTNGSVMMPHPQAEQTARILAIQSNAVVYIVVVLLLYATALVAIMVRYLKRDRDESRLSYLYHEFVKMDIFGRHKKVTEEADCNNHDSRVIITIAANNDVDSGDSEIVTHV